MRFPAEIEEERYKEINVSGCANSIKNSEILQCVFKIEVGYSTTEDHNTENKATLKLEMENNFGVPGFSSGSVKIGAEYSHSWSNSITKTWNTQQTLELTYDVKPGFEVVIKQLQASYGPVKVLGKHLVEQKPIGY